MSRHPVVQIDTEHPSAFGVGPARWRERLRRRLEATSGRPVEVVHYLDARELGDAHAVVLSGSSAPWAAHDPAALRRLGEVVGASGRPVLGICAGMQLLGRFAGGRIEHAAEPEIGELELDVVEPDGLLRGLGERPRVFQYHFDELDRAPGGLPGAGLDRALPRAGDRERGARLVGHAVPSRVVPLGESRRCAHPAHVLRAGRRARHRF